MQELARAHDNGRTVLASSFGATLEMAREGHIELRQEGPFAPIYMRRASLMPRSPMPSGSASSKLVKPVCVPDSQ